MFSQPPTSTANKPFSCKQRCIKSQFTYVWIQRVPHCAIFPMWHSHRTGIFWYSTGIRTHHDTPLPNIITTVFNTFLWCCTQSSVLKNKICQILAALSAYWMTVVSHLRQLLVLRPPFIVRRWCCVLCSRGSWCECESFARRCLGGSAHARWIKALWLSPCGTVPLRLPLLLITLLIDCDGEVFSRRGIVLNRIKRIAATRCCVKLTDREILNYEHPCSTDSKLRLCTVLRHWDTFPACSRMHLLDSYVCGATVKYLNWTINKSINK